MQYLRSYFKKHVALTSEHGSWVFLFSPLIIGLFAGHSWNRNAIYLLEAALGGFLIRQPITIIIKTLSGRRSKRDLPAARFWVLIYSLIGLLGVWGLVRNGFAFLLILAIPGVLVFTWHLHYVYQRAERRQMEIEIVASGVLALAAPAGYWVGKGELHPDGWWLWLLIWLQSASSIVHAYMRLRQRELGQAPSIKERIRIGQRALLYTSFNVLLVGVLSVTGILPSWLIIPYLLQWGETLWGTFRPAVGVKPNSIGFRQLAVSILFTILFILAWNIL